MPFTQIRQVTYFCLPFSWDAPSATTSVINPPSYLREGWRKGEERGEERAVEKYIQVLHCLFSILTTKTNVIFLKINPHIFSSGFIVHQSSLATAR